MLIAIASTPVPAAGALDAGSGAGRRPPARRGLPLHRLRQLDGRRGAARGVRARDGDVGRYRQDNLVITLTYPSGSVATIVYVANGDKDAGKERIEAFAGGRLTRCLNDYRELELHKGGRSSARQAAAARPTRATRPSSAAFLAAVRGEQPAGLPWADIVATMLATFAAQGQPRARRRPCPSGRCPTRSPSRVTAARFNTARRPPSWPPIRAPRSSISPRPRSTRVGRVEGAAARPRPADIARYMAANAAHLVLARSPFEPTTVLGAIVAVVHDAHGSAIRSRISMTFCMPMQSLPLVRHRHAEAGAVVSVPPCSTPSPPLRAVQPSSGSPGVIVHPAGNDRSSGNRCSPSAPRGGPVVPVLAAAALRRPGQQRYEIGFT